MATIVGGIRAAISTTPTLIQAIGNGVMPGAWLAFAAVIAVGPS